MKVKQIKKIIKANFDKLCNLFSLSNVHKLYFDVVKNKNIAKIHTEMWKAHGIQCSHSLDISGHILFKFLRASPWLSVKFLQMNSVIALAVSLDLQHYWPLNMPWARAHTYTCTHPWQDHSKYVQNAYRNCKPLVIQMCSCTELISSTKTLPEVEKDWQSYQLFL